MQSIDFHPDYLEAVRAGRKTTTVRYREDIAPGPAELVFDGARLTAEVVRIVRTTADLLTDADARADGFEDRGVLMRRLQGLHYPGMPDDAPVEIVHFRVTG